MRLPSRAVNPNSPLPPGLAIGAVVSDVDGVLTDGSVGISASGHKFRTFHVHDGMGVKLLAAAGIRVAWLSSSQDDGVIRARAASLGVNAVDVADGDKGTRLRRLCEVIGVPTTAILYIGDDVNDLPAIHLAAASVCPADARPEVRAAVTHVLKAPSGRGAFREAADIVLDHLGAHIPIPPSIELA